MTMEKLKAYHKDWSYEDLGKARDQGIVIDDGEAWRYQHTHEDALGKYDIWYRNTSPLDVPAEDEPMAFPVACMTDNDFFQREGMTLRDWFAGQAMMGMITTAGAPAINGLEGHELTTASYAYAIADAMMEARKK